MANPYPIEIADAGDGSVKVAGKATFTDPSNQPGGGSQPGALSLLGPFAVDFDTPNLINSSDNGVPTLAIPAGSVVDAFVLGTAEWTGAAAGDPFVLALAASSDGSAQTVADYELLDVSASLPALALREATTLYSANALLAAYTPRRARAVVACHVYAAVFPAGAISAGSADIYAWVATPA